MAYCHCYQIAITLAILVLVSLSSPSGAADRLSADLHKTYNKCTDEYIFSIVKNVVTGAINKEKRMGASLLRLHFHDCFVKGCDGSVLLDDTDSFTGEKNAGPNRNSARGFDVVDEIKSAVEEACPGKVSCADILAIAARDSVVLLGGPSWEVRTGRRDAKTASRDAANQGIPGPNSNLTALINRFDALGLNTTDLVALSGAHTIGLARCTNFRARIYNESNMDQTYAKSLRKNCSSVSGQGDNNTAPLDYLTPYQFDNNYYVNLVKQDGLLHSDQVLHNGNELIESFVKDYKTHSARFLNDFAVAMVKMGNIGLLNGTAGEIRKDCRKVNAK